MLASAADLMRRRGSLAVSTTAVLVDSGAPRGSFFHYFPGGRQQLIVEALGDVGDRMASALEEQVADATPRELVSALRDCWREELVTKGFDAGCPITGAVVSGASTNPDLRTTAERAFHRWYAALAVSLTQHGMSETRSRSVAITMIASLEGTLILARCQRSLTPLCHVTGELAHLIDTLTLEEPEAV